MTLPLKMVLCVAIGFGVAFVVDRILHPKRKR